jgi:hypothetical protein
MESIYVYAVAVLDGLTCRVYPPSVAAPNKMSPTAVVDIPLILRLSVFTSNVMLSSFTLRVLPDLLNASPATICPAPENCAKLKFVVSSVIGLFVVRTYPLSAPAVPSSTNTNNPEVTSAEVFASQI